MGKLRRMSSAAAATVLLLPLGAVQADETGRSGYDKGFFVESADGDFKMTIGGYMQGLGLVEVLESAPDVDTFRVRRARLKFGGHLFSKDVQYQLEYEFAANRLLSTYVQFVASPALKVTVGQFKVPFNFEAITSGSRQQFVDRSIAHGVFGIRDEREVGAGISGELLEKKLEYALGAFNGEGINTLNVNNELRYAGRLVYNVSGRHGYSFADTKGSKEPHIAIGMAGFYNDTPVNLDDLTLGEKKDTAFTTDASVKYLGLGFHGAFFYRHTNPGSVNDKGWLAQAGYFFVPEKIEAGARVAHVYPEGRSRRGEYTVGLNYYMFGGHQVKVQTDYSVLTEKDGIAAGDDRVDHRVRAQVQIAL